MTSDFALQVPADLESALQMKTVRYFVTQRPWLDLYGIHVRPVAPFGSTSGRLDADPALIHRSLPDELLVEVFVRMSPYDLGRGACVCRKWRYAIRSPVLWRNACLKAWQLFGIRENYKLLQSKYESSWRKMWLLRPRIRTDGLYVSRNTYIRTGVREWTVTNPVHLVCYFRYMRFLSSGRFLYRNSSQVVREVAKYMNHHRASKSDGVFTGRYSVNDDQVEAAFLYPGVRPTLWKIRLRLRGTQQGANNRMDLLSLVTSKVNSEGISGPEEEVLGAVDALEDEITRTSHRRGLAAFVFVPFEEADTCVLNLPVDKMDYYVPG